MSSSKDWDEEDTEFITNVLRTAEYIKEELNYTKYHLSEIMFQTEIDGVDVTFKIKPDSEEE